MAVNTPLTRRAAATSCPNRIRNSGSAASSARMTLTAISCRLRPDVRIVRQNRSGKGNALACGFAAATGDIIAMVDADGSADPAEIPQFVQALLDGADFAKGTRFAGGGGSCDITRLRRLGNRVLSGLVNMLCRTRYSDLCYGYNVFWRRHVPVFGLQAESDIPAGSGTRLWGGGFEVEPPTPL